MKKAKFRIVRMKYADHLRYKIEERTWIFWSRMGFAEYASVIAARVALTQVIKERRAKEDVVGTFDEAGEAV